MRPIRVTTRENENTGTLGAELRSLALAHLPSRFYLALQLALPAAVQFWARGWTRTAACMVVASAFGIWALGEQALNESGDAMMGNGPLKRTSRGIHWVAGVLAGGLSAVLVLDLMLRFFSLVFRCPGCAG